MIDRKIKTIQKHRYVYTKQKYKYAQTAYTLHHFCHIKQFDEHQTATIFRDRIEKYFFKAAMLQPVMHRSSSHGLDPTYKRRSHKRMRTRIRLKLKGNDEVIGDI